MNLLKPISISNAEHYRWGENCDGWHLVQQGEMSVIQERVPPGCAEIMHYHEKSRQFFYILQGEGTMAFEGESIKLKHGEGLEIPPRLAHQFRNDSEEDVIFLVMSVPKSHGDRIDIK